jgi:cardiolipin synthase
MTEGHFTILLMASVYLMALANCIRVLTNERTTSGAAIAWILFHLILPILAIPLFWLLGDFRISGYVKKHRERSLAVNHRIQDESLSDLQFTLTAQSKPFFELCQNVFTSLGPNYNAHLGTIRLLVDGKSTFEAIFEKIAAAQKYILVQYYIIRHDRLGLELKRLLIKKAKQGIPIYFLYDDMGSFWLSSQYINDLKTHGIKTAQFLRVAHFRRFFQINFRNHRKIVVVDGVFAFTGGLNVGEEYIAPRSKKSRRYWRDTHLMISGSPIHQIEEVFQEDWVFATNEKALLPASPSLEKNIKEDPETASPPLNLYPIRVVATGPADETLVSLTLLQCLIHGAQSRLWITTPYFVPDLSILRAIELAILRGVDVRLMLPSHGDSRVVHWASLSIAQQVQKMGGKVLLFEAGFTHQKVILVDNSAVAIGTMNIDNRAIYLNFETMILIHSQQVASEVEQMLKIDFSSCQNFTVDPRPIVRKLMSMRGNATKVLAPLL